MRHLSLTWETLVAQVDQHVDNIRNTPQPESPIGQFSMFGLAVVIGAIGWYFGGFSVLFHDTPGFLGGNALAMTRGNGFFATSLATIVVMLAACIICAQLVTWTVGKASGDHAVGKELANMAMGNQFASLTFVVMLEELFARGLCLWLLPKIPGLGGETAFYVLFFLGNSIWAVIHLTNFTNPKDRHVLRVLPQFVGGICLTYIFVKYGFVMGLMVHLGFDALVFAVHKREKVTGYDMVAAVYAAVVALIAYWCMSKSVTDLSAWFADGASSFVIPGWTYWDYFKADVFLTLALSAVFGFLCFDRPAVVTKKDNVPLIAVVFFAAIAVVIFYGLYWAMGYVTANMDIRAILVGLLVACLQRGRSGSSVSRAFWCTIPSVFISLCVMEAVGFWETMAITVTEHFLEIPIFALNREASASDESA